MLNVPGSERTYSGLGISGNLVTGSYYTTAGGYFDHGFVYDILTGTYTTLDVPDSYGTDTGLGAIAGTTVYGGYLSDDETFHMFTANLSAVPEPHEWAAISFGVLALTWVLKRRPTASPV